jgi:uncharacterized protein (TIGR03067 family)
MRRTVHSVCAVLFVVVALASDSPKEYDDKTEYVGIEGAWRLTDSTQNGNQLPLSSRPIVMTLRRGTLTFDRGYGHANRGTYRIASAGKLSHFDRVPVFGPYPCVSGKCISQLDGDTLRIAGFPGKPNERPRGFDDEGVIIETYMRLK